MVLLRDAGSLCGRRSETLEDRAGCRPRGVFGYRHPFKQRQKPRGDLAAREDTGFRHARQTPNGTGSQVVGTALPPPPIWERPVDLASPKIRTRQLQARAQRRARQARRFWACAGNRCPCDDSARGKKGAATALAIGPRVDCGNRHHLAAGMRRKALWEALCLSCGTSPERIAPESLTRCLSEFVHGDMSWPTLGIPPHRVNGVGSPSAAGRQFVNSSVACRIRA